MSPTRQLLNPGTRQQMIRNRQVRIRLLALLVCLFNPNVCPADSAISLLSGFDPARIDAAYPPLDDDSAGELAKLVFRLLSVAPQALQSRVGDATNELGDAVQMEGRILNIMALKVPDRLVEFLELSRLQLLDIDTDQGQVQVVTTALPSKAKPGDAVSGVGVLIEDASVTAVATARLRWFPKSPESDGWKLLSETGLDVSLLADAASRSRKALMAEDGDAFYSLLAAAAEVGRRDNLPQPPAVEPVTLLSEPDGLVGQWLRMDLETVQVTRITVSEPHRQAQLGSDHYYQIDAVGDLKNVAVKIERPEGNMGPPILFENRYPVSVVVRELPDFLKQQIRLQEGGDAVLAEIRLMVQADVFFYRLWSYSTDFMSQQGGGDQFGPLLVAARIYNQQPSSVDPARVGVISWIAAFAVVSSIIATWLWNRRTAERDAEVRRKRKERESEQLEIPT